jgi:hypothetical protein
MATKYYQARSLAQVRDGIRRLLNDFDPKQPIIPTIQLNEVLIHVWPLVWDRCGSEPMLQLPSGADACVLVAGDSGTGLVSDVDVGASVRPYLDYTLVPLEWQSFDVVNHRIKNDMTMLGAVQRGTPYWCAPEVSNVSGTIKTRLVFYPAVDRACTLYWHRSQFLWTDLDWVNDQAAAAVGSLAFLAALEAKCAGQLLRMQPPEALQRLGMGAGAAQVLDEMGEGLISVETERRAMHKVGDFVDRFER